MVVSCLAGCARTEDRVPAPQAVSPQALNDANHLLLLVELSPSGLKALQSQVVDSPPPKLRVPEPWPWHVTVRDPEGAVVYEENIPPQNQLRGEFAGEDGRIEGHHLLRATAAFPLRVPNVRGTLTLTVQRKTLSSEDPRSIGPGDTVDVGTLELPPAVTK